VHFKEFNSKRDKKEYCIERSAVTGYNYKFNFKKKKFCYDYSTDFSEAVILLVLEFSKPKKLNSVGQKDDAVALFFQPISSSKLDGSILLC